MKKQKIIGYDYGECEICDAQMEEQIIKLDIWRKGELIVIDGVPAGVCPHCGEKIVKNDIGETIIKLLENSDRIANAPKMSIPFIKFEQEKMVKVG